MMKISIKYGIIIASVIIGTLLCYWFVDIPIAWFFHHEDQSSVRVMADRITEAGNSAWILVPSLVLWIVLWRKWRDHAKKWMVLFLSVAVSGILANIIKVIVCRTRPPLLFDKGIYDIDMFGFVIDFLHNSFPSGHATTAMSAATVGAIMFPALRIPLYIAGGIVAFSRVMVGVHYFSDVIVGTFIGVATALFFSYKFLR